MSYEFVSAISPYIDWQNLQLNQEIPFSGGRCFAGNEGGWANSKGWEIGTRNFGILRVKD